MAVSGYAGPGDFGVDRLRSNTASVTIGADRYVLSGPATASATIRPDASGELRFDRHGLGDAPLSARGRLVLDAPPAAGLRVRHFINIADCGIGGEVVARVNRSTARWAGGTATFLWHSLAALLSYRPRAARVEVDGETVEGRFQNVVIANGRYFGGGMCVAPGADCADGLFDVVLFGDLSRLRSLTGIRRIYAGSHLGTPGVSLRRGRTVRVTPLDDEPLWFEMEGEEVGPAPATATLLPGAVRLAVPPPGAVRR